MIVESPKNAPERLIVRTKYVSATNESIWIGKKFYNLNMLGPLQIHVLQRMVVNCFDHLNYDSKREKVVQL